MALRLGHNYVGTEHVLSALSTEREGATTTLLARLGVSRRALEGELRCRLMDSTSAARIDPEALAALGIDLKVVRECLEQTFGEGALKRTAHGCIGICPRLKMALAYALDHAHDGPLQDEHVLLGMLRVPDSVAALVLAEFGVTLDEACAVVGSRP